MNWLSCGQESMTICSAVLIQYQRVTDEGTDGQTDRRTDRKPVPKTCISMVVARKNEAERRMQLNFVLHGDKNGCYYCYQIEFLTCVRHTAHVIDIGWTSVCPSHADIVSKRLNLSSNCLHCLVTP